MAHITDLGFTADELVAAVEAGDVRSQVHPEHPVLRIYNYTEDVQFRNRWNKVTLACRGLILDTVTWEVVARPWEKFFNFGQRDNRIDSNAPVEVTDKMDGSLGILYKQPNGQYAIATRGSFASEQALHATEVLYQKYPLVMAAYTGINGDSVFSEQVAEWTFLFEIIYPENRIVVNYGDMDDLVMLGAVHKQYGHYVGPNVAAAMLIWSGPVTEMFSYPTFVDALSAPDRKGKEGIVIRSGRNIVKLKQADYVELHRIVTNLSPKTIWEMLAAGKTIGDICAQIPDEFHKYVTDIGEELFRQVSEITFQVHSTWYDIKYYADNRKKFAEKATKTPYAKYLFMMLDGKSINDVVWNEVKPRGDVKTLVEGE